MSCFCPLQAPDCVDNPPATCSPTAEQPCDMNAQPGTACNASPPSESSSCSGWMNYSLDSTGSQSVSNIDYPRENSFADSTGSGNNSPAALNQRGSEYEEFQAHSSSSATARPINSYNFPQGLQQLNGWENRPQHYDPFYATAERNHFATQHYSMFNNHNAFYQPATLQPQYPYSYHGNGAYNYAMNRPWDSYRSTWQAQYENNVANLSGHPPGQFVAAPKSVAESSGVGQDNLCSPQANDSFAGSFQSETPPAAQMGSPESSAPESTEPQQQLNDSGSQGASENAKSSTCKAGSEKQSGKPAVTYVAMIAQALLSAPNGKMTLSEIYDYIANRYPFYKTTTLLWRNSVRHNLSVNECFSKAGRTELGRGFYWTVHPQCLRAFSMGDFRRRSARSVAQRDYKRLAKAEQQVSQFQKANSEQTVSLRFEPIASLSCAQ